MLFFILIFSFHFWTAVQREVPCPFVDLALYLLIYLKKQKNICFFSFIGRRLGVIMIKKVLEPDLLWFP